jgi:amino acid adenylation domain-containing protein
VSETAGRTDTARRIAGLSPRRRALLERLATDQGVDLIVERPEEELVAGPRPGHLPLSFAQQRLWFVDRLQPGEATYNIPSFWRLRGPLDAGALAAALDAVSARHEPLRTRFVVTGGEPAQSIDSPLPRLPPRIDLRSLPQASRERELARLATAEATRPFDLARGPLLRSTLLVLGREEHAALWTLHHIAADGWSLGVFVRELGELYGAAAGGRPPRLAPLAVHYADYALWQRRWLTGGRLQADVAWWRERLAGVPALLALPTDRPRPPIKSARGGSVFVNAPADLLGALRRLGRHAGATLFMSLLAGFTTLLARGAGQRRFAIGTPVAGRTRRELEPLIGLFVNTLVLPLEVEPRAAFAAQLAQVRETLLAAYAHQEIPFEKLVEELHPERSLAHEPLFQILFTLQNTPAPGSGLPGLSAVALPVTNGAAKFDLSLFGEERADGLALSLEYAADLFDTTTARRLLAALVRLLAAAAAAPSLPLGELPLLDAAERHQAMVEWNDSGSAPAWQGCVHELIARQAARRAAATALTAAGAALSFAELERRVHQGARRLRRMGVGPGTLVGLCARRSAELVVTLLAVLEAGGAYVPLDPASPAARLAVMIEDSRPGLLVGDPPLLARLPDTPAPRLELPDPAAAAESPEPLPSLAGPDDLAYVLFTSGSTGRPKGVMVTHRGLMGYLHWALAAYPSAGGSLLHTSLAFDLSVTSLFLPLLAGQPLALVPEDEGGAALVAALHHSPPRGFLKLTPSHARLLAAQLAGEDAGGSLALVVGGEALLAEELGIWRRAAPATRIYNEYGPTEAVVGCCVAVRTAGELTAGAVPIGRPIAGVRLYVLDSLDADGAPLHTQPVGAMGELWIGGPGLAPGYLGRSELTAERFRPDPFGPPGARLYRTGDLARWRADGELDYLGRIDHQVKIRGVRVELGEIEATLARHPAVREAVVEASLDSSGTRRLAAYVVPRDGRLEAPALREYLREHLPEAMVPARFVRLAALPLTGSGKVDRRALPPPLSAAEDEPPRATGRGPRDPLELALHRIWEEVLEVADLTVDDNFFDRGGHSLAALRLVHLLHERCGLELPVASLFHDGTIERQAARLRTLAPAAAQPAAPRRVLLATGGEGAPLFLVHPVGGGVLCYFELTRRLRAADRPMVWGLQRLQAAGARSVEDLARLYLDEVEGAGPLRLAGWSMGALVAYDMARQWRQAGREVVSLVLLDPPPATSEPSGVATDERLLLGRFAADLLQGTPGEVIALADALEPAPAAQLLANVCAEAERRYLLPPGLDRELIQRLFAVFRANLAAASSYRPAAYGGPLALLLARGDDESAEELAARAASWCQLAAGAVGIHHVPGGHYGLVRPARAAAWASRLAAGLGLPPLPPRARAAGELETREPAR